MAKRVLIIDDDPNIVNLIKTFINKLGFETIVSQDGLDGLNQARSQKPDLIILDIMLPKLDGYKLSRYLKYDEQYRRIPIIMLTAKSDERDEEIGRATSADAYITKPFDNQKLITTIKELVA